MLQEQENLNLQDRKTERKEGESHTIRKIFSFQIVKVPKSSALPSVFGRFSMSVQNKETAISTLSDTTWILSTVPKLREAWKKLGRFHVLQ